MSIITFILVAWILSWFKFERIIITAFKELFGKEITKATYYLIFFIIGVFGEIVLLFQGAYLQLFLNN